MAKIKPKLYLNMSPQTAEENSLVYARNMKVDDDGNLTSDFGYNDIEAMADYNIVGHIVGLNNKIYFFCVDFNAQTSVWENSLIVEYDEITKDVEELDTLWTYSGGEYITGCVNTNQSGERILTIAEHRLNSNIPIKHINIDVAHPDNANESIYCQAPKCPTANLVLYDTYVKTIPNGVYVFFIRYRIREGVYTNWFLCSRPIFGGTADKINTLQGGLKYINLHKDSARSFIFDLNFAVETNKNSFDEFQLGFIITHDEGSDARIWKSFKLDSFTAGTDKIYFDYEDIKEANVDEMLATTYELYNVKNVTSFKNKLYISNYKESDLNPDLTTLASKIHLSVGHTSQSGDTDISYRSGTFKPYSTEYNMIYDNDKGFFTKITKNGTDYNINHSQVEGTLLYTPSKLIKGDSYTVEDIVEFDVKWNDDWQQAEERHSAYYSDIAAVNNIKNKIYGGNVYGLDYSEPYNNGMVGIKKIDDIGYGGDNSKAVFAPDGFTESGDYEVETLGLSSHPWYDKDLSFVFGCVNSDDFGITTCKFKRTGTKYKWDSSHKKGWIADNGEFNDINFDDIHQTLLSECSNKSKFVKCYLEVYYGVKTYKLQYATPLDDKYFAISDSTDNAPSGTGIVIKNKNAVDSDLTSDIQGWITAIIEGTNGLICGISDTGTPIIAIDDNGTTVYVPAENVSVKFKLFEFNINYEDLGTSGDTKLNRRYKVDLTTTEYTSICGVKFVDGKVKITDNSETLSQASTLMPKSKYQAYIHFVDEHNIVSNGIKYTYQSGGQTLDTIETPDIYNNTDKLILKYSTDIISNINKAKYKSFFISLINVGDIIIEGFGYTKANGMHILHSLELDAMLYNINDNITVIDPSAGTPTITPSAKYYSSGESYPPLAFGNCGFVAWPVSGNEDYTDKHLYIVIERGTNKESKHELIKASSYITFSTQSTAIELPDGFYGSYFCLVKKPDFVLSSDVYVSGNDIYSVDRSSSIKLTDFKSYVQVQNSVTHFIRSNFNLNYLNLTEDITDKIFNIGGASSGLKQVAKVINSAILSYIYELKSMYKDFLNKKFSEHTTNNKTTFDNTIRVSNILSDETSNNSIFKFESGNYYNVPTDRGIIVSLFAIGNNIFVHTKGSFYKFDATQTIMASDSDISLKEAEPFDAGIVQLFDSQYGYGGIDNKEAGCITFDSYVFYDRLSNHIFAYSGNGQVQLIDGSIYKFLKYYNFETCYTLHDDINHRILFEFITNSDKHICLSYNYKAKGFISFHDITLNKAFASRLKCYSYNKDLIDLFDAEDIETDDLNTDMHLTKIYGDASSVSDLFFGAQGYNENSSPFSIAVVLFPVETVRETIDTIKYVSNLVKDSIVSKTVSQDDYDFIANLEHTTFDSDGVPVNPVESLYIATDSCLSNLVEGTIDDSVRPEIGDYKSIKHDIDSWNVNYFRNILHSDNIYGYPGEEDANGPGQPRVHYKRIDITPARIETYSPNSDNFSLVYGKYFIINFNFSSDKAIKFEEIFITTNKY